MKFYILGASGFMGSRCSEYLKNKGHEVLTEKIEVSDFSALKRRFGEAKPEAVINFAGVRAYPNIDWCENNKEETVRVNIGGAINAMTAAIGAGAYPIQISSGCIYSGGPDTPFSEEDPPNFFGSFYSKMRIVMQEAFKELPVLQARIRMPLSMYPHPRNLINKIVSYEKVISVPNSVTLVEDLFPVLEKLSEIKPLGILNLTNDGHVENKKILDVYKEVIDQNHTYTIITPEKLHESITRAQRSNCVLSNDKAKSLDISMPALDRNRLEEIMRIFKDSLN